MVGMQTGIDRCLLLRTGLSHSTGPWWSRHQHIPSRADGGSRPTGVTVSNGSAHSCTHTPVCVITYPTTRQSMAIIAMAQEVMLLSLITGVCVVALLPWRINGHYGQGMMPTHY